MGGLSGRSDWGGGSGRANEGGGSRRADLRGGGGAHAMPPRPSIGKSQAPLTSHCPPSNHTITLNLTIGLAAI